MLAADYVFGASVAFVIGCSLYFRPRIRSDRIAMQWGLDGKPTWYAPKWLALLSGWFRPTIRNKFMASKWESWALQ
jgi:hypothetical protein